MIGLKALVDMVLTESIEGCSRDYFFDEAINREYISPYKPSEQYTPKTKLPPIKYRLELIENPDGTLEWVE